MFGILALEKKYSFSRRKIKNKDVKTDKTMNISKHVFCVFVQSIKSK